MPQSALALTWPTQLRHADAATEVCPPRILRHQFATLSSPHLSSVCARASLTMPRSTTFSANVLMSWLTSLPWAVSSPHMSTRLSPQLLTQQTPQMAPATPQIQPLLCLFQLTPLSTKTWPTSHTYSQTSSLPLSNVAASLSQTEPRESISTIATAVSRTLSNAQQALALSCRTAHHAQTTPSTLLPAPMDRTALALASITVLLDNWPSLNSSARVTMPQACTSAVLTRLNLSPSGPSSPAQLTELRSKIAHVLLNQVSLAALALDKTTEDPTHLL